MKTETREMLVQPGVMRSFGRTATRMSPAEQAQLEARLAPYGIEIKKERTISSSSSALMFPQTLNLDDVFVRKNRPLVVEVGMGNGEYLFNRASQNIQENHIGIEVYKNGLRSLARKLEEAEKNGKGLKNIKICDEDARTVLAALPEASVDELVILYPDPWPKKRHHKRRIVNQELLNVAAQVIKPGGTLFIATDIADYAHWALGHVLAHPAFECLAQNPADLGVPPVGWQATKYERKAMKAGRVSWYLTFHRVDV